MKGRIGMWRHFRKCKYLEDGVFDVNVNNLNYKVQFSLNGLSNDLKNLAFLAGELAVSAYIHPIWYTSQHSWVRNLEGHLKILLPLKFNTAMTQLISIFRTIHCAYGWGTNGLWQLFKTLREGHDI